MRRILIALVSALALALAVPGLALAHHRGHHHGARHRHHHGARVLRFGFAEEGGKGGEETAGTTTSSSSSSSSSETVGTIQSFEGGVLKIKLTDGTLVSGKVTEDTHLCVIPGPTSSGETQKEEAGDDEQQGDDDSSDGGLEGSSGSGSSDEAGSEDHHASTGEDSSDGGESLDGGDHGGCSDPSTTSALVAGAGVTAAELRITSSGSTWELVVVQQ